MDLLLILEFQEADGLHMLRVAELINAAYSFYSIAGLLDIF